MKAQVAPAFTPVVGLFGEDGAKEADDGVRVGGMQTQSVWRGISRLRCPLGLFDQIWYQTCLGRFVNARIFSLEPPRYVTTAVSLTST